MANKQIYELTTRTFDGDSLLPISVENPDSSTATEYPQLAGKTSGNALSDFVANDQQYATDLDTENKTITGAINELHSSIGADTYNSASTYNKGDIVIYNGTLYACNDNSVTGTWNASKWDSTTLQPKTDNTLDTTAKTITGAINELKSGLDIIGTRIDGSKQATVFTKSWGQKGYIILNKGTWIIFCHVLLQQDANGFRAMNIATTSGDSTPQVINMGISGQLTSLRLETCVTVNSNNTTYYWNGIHNSTQNLELTIENWGLFAIRIA